MEISAKQVSQDLFLLLERFKVHAQTLAETQGITRIQLFVLYAIGQHDELTMRQVAGLLHCDASNITGIVDRLVAQHLVVRKEGVHDRRIKTLRLTERGKHVVGSIKEALPALLGCDVLTADERAALHATIQKLTA